MENLKTTLIVASIISVLLVSSYVGFSLWQQNRDLIESRTTAEHGRQYAEELKAALAASQAHIIELQQEKEAVTKAQKTLEQEMRSALESKDITISQLQGKLTVNILDRILFDSGEAVLKVEGEQVLQQIANILAQHPNRQIHVIGHTDNVPIRASARNRFTSNWELSTARATAAVRFLSEKAGVDPRRLGALGYGEFHPIADNTTAEGRAKNRRIALVVLSEELAGSDAVPATIPFTSSGTLSTAATNAVLPVSADLPLLNITNQSPAIETNALAPFPESTATPASSVQSTNTL